MNKYELMIVVKAQLAQDAKDTIYKQTNETVTKNGGKVTGSQVWLEKHKMPFSIKKSFESTYYLVKFEGASDVVEKIKAALKLNEDVLRFLITKN